ncbi:MAG: nucleoside hydrolase, partial [Nocardioides sp.]|uniref:nucleoside hydrolase n=1 Tax=Nocardioides sp. TaxID=35761 RepID=UPI0039E6F6FB
MLAAPWPVTLVPLDVTMRQPLTPDDQAVIGAAGAPAVAAIGRMLDCYLDFYEQVSGVREAVLHDPLAAAVAAGDVEVSLDALTHVVVDTGTGPTRGATPSDRRALAGPGAGDSETTRL